ncbi:TerB family tellurite resistance protein, partial [bacterium]|nr:TerB family tellurite resistance protein [bacterium]
MGKFAKWIGGGLGFVFGGPIGGLLGFFLGSVVDGTSVKWQQTGGDRRVYRTTPGDFGMSLLVLIAAVMKADGKVLRSELDYVKRFFVSQFGPDTAQEALQMLRDLLRQDIPLRDVCMQIRSNMDYPSRLQLIHILYNISAADNRFETAETNVIKSIADMLGISTTDYDSIRNM